jgi:hypothetical protein
MARFEPVEEVINQLCERSGDYLRRRKGLYLSVADDVWNDLNETTLKIAKRVKIPVRRQIHLNRRTNSIDLPCNSNRLASVNVVDECGIIHPVYRNLSLHDDIVSLPADQNCACEHKCGYRLCNMVKGYVAIQSTQTNSLPNGTPISFNCIDRIVHDKNGVVYKETQYPKRIYTGGVWTDTILYTESTKICECEVDENGCLCDTEHNITLLCESCGIRNFQSNIAPRNHTECVGGTATCAPHPGCNEWTYFCDNKMDWFTVQCGCEGRKIGRNFHNIYNLGENEKRLIFPPEFCFEKALVRYYEDISLDKLVIPYIAKQTFMAGVVEFASEFNAQVLAETGNMFNGKYSRYKWGLFVELNKMRTAELANIIAPAAYVPSYMDHREDRRFWYF